MTWLENNPEDEGMIVEFSEFLHSVLAIIEEGFAPDGIDWGLFTDDEVEANARAYFEQQPPEPWDVEAARSMGHDFLAAETDYLLALRAEDDLWDLQ